jgi:hypothetical protein
VGSMLTTGMQETMCGSDRRSIHRNPPKIKYTPRGVEKTKSYGGVSYIEGVGVKERQNTLGTKNIHLPTLVST